ncbi:kinesin family protein [Aspergillus chevalieri]|uniref:Kinesin motor domain-containing protein n=1 Tax=Aspergillus chevalieri TaxID=182096 RepID=A0A7R7VLU9_ASPCH|nr:uncharacterized protein ACHE_30290S [Aspergillus chevalieri]BCR86303.1 hypothetical protein ACHE_30290S [Aspergillus chevalieri]
MHQFNVFTRWRPLSTDNEQETSEIKRVYEKHDKSRISMSIATPDAARQRPWKSEAAFTQLFEASDDNKAVFDAVVAPTLPQVLNGQTCNFFAYGHSGSGKSHTIVGYDFGNSSKFGLCLSAARELSETLEQLNADNCDESSRLGIGFRMYNCARKRHLTCSITTASAISARAMMDRRTSAARLKC